LKESVDKIYVNTGNDDVLKLINSDWNMILDVGCGAGILAKILSENGHTVDGITISPEE
jgi:2-polyprenyl-3-methyl-5-hydroxy-6-metoxy-1,4-benzoquinol methylase